MKFLVFVISFLTFSFSHFCYAKQLGVFNLKQYKCMDINLSTRDLMDDRLYIPIKKFPNPKSKTLFRADAMIIAFDPEKRRNGYTEILCPDWSLGWIQSKFIRPWRVSDHPDATCHPQKNPDGTPAFGYGTRSPRR